MTYIEIWLTDEHKISPEHQGIKKTLSRGDRAYSSYSRGTRNYLVDFLSTKGCDVAKSSLEFVANGRADRVATGFINW